MRTIRFDSAGIFALLLLFGLLFCKTDTVAATEPAIVASITSYNHLVSNLNTLFDNAGVPQVVLLGDNDPVPLPLFERDKPAGFVLFCDREPTYFFFPNKTGKPLPEEIAGFIPQPESDQLFHVAIYPKRLPRVMIEHLGAIARSQLAHIDSDVATMIQTWQEKIVETMRTAQLIEFSLEIDPQGGLLFKQTTTVKKGEDEEFNCVGYSIDLEVFKGAATLIQDQLWLPAGYSPGELKEDDRLDSNFFIESVQTPPEPTADTSALFSTPGKDAGEKRILSVNGVSLPFSWIPPGTFLMGSPKEESHHDSSEMQHEVTIPNGFWMLQTEVTQAMYQAICENNPSFFIGDSLPVDTVTWHDCIQFCEKLTALLPAMQGQFTLPTEQQWEYATRAGTTGETYSPLEEIAWFGEPTATGSTHPVATKKPNSWNLFDMTGNLWEWCLTPYYDYPNPTTPDFDPPTRIDRGGCWDSPAHQCRNATRGTYERDRKSRFVGFRIVFPLSW